MTGKGKVPTTGGKGGAKARSPPPRSDKPKVSRSKKASLVFPVSRLGRYLKHGRYSKRVGEHAPVYMASVMEYLCAEMLELAGGCAERNNRQRIAPRHIQLAIREDEELQRFLSDVTLASAGAVRHVEAPDLKSKKKKKTSNHSKAAWGEEEEEENDEYDEGEESESQAF